MADEAADIYNEEDLSVVMRFVDNSKSIHEAFVGLHLCDEGTTGEAIWQLIVNAVEELDLSMNDYRRQSYDGAGYMAGRYTGAATLVV